MIAFFGMGLLGSNFVRALRRRGEEVRVWNRSLEKAAALEAVGARSYANPAAAAAGAARVHLTLSDDAAVDQVLEQAAPGLMPGTIIVDHTTTLASGIADRTARFRERGITFVHAPVFMGPQNALESSGIMMISGDRAELAALEPHLQAMTGKLVYLGPRPDAAAAFKLMGNLFLMFLTTGLADLLALGKALSVPPEEAAKLLEFFNPGTTVSARLKRMTDGKFSEPSWALQMARKDAGLMLKEAAAAEVPLAVLPAIAAAMDAAIAEGHGHDDWTVLGKVK